MLITLAIIGVVAALTIPSVVRNYQKKQTLVQVKKAFTTLAQVTNTLISENGTLNDWDVQKNAERIDEIGDWYSKKFKTIKVCKNIEGCWTKEKTIGLNGNNIDYSDAKGMGAGGGDYGYTFVLNDGTKISMSVWNSYGYFGLNLQQIGNSKKVLAFFIDINGDKKPNQLGADVFAFVVTNNGVYPSRGSCNRADVANNTTSGYGCAYKIIKEDGVNY